MKLDKNQFHHFGEFLNRHASAAVCLCVVYGAFQIVWRAPGAPCVLLACSWRSWRAPGVLLACLLWAFSGRAPGVLPALLARSWLSPGVLWVCSGRGPGVLLASSVELLWACPWCTPGLPGQISWF